ncbi:MAG: isoprenylcysteine carboxylmethyltransferase family protein [Syntrophobacteraceae bacterium]|jgi:protein-S-isoprenylcysteine O-methyltransferase Ste14
MYRSNANSYEKMTGPIYIPPPPAIRPEAHVVKWRQNLTRALAVALSLPLLFAEGGAGASRLGSITCQVFGLFLVTVAAFGRLWALMFIAGAKDSVVVAQGPYSMVRNPLYCFSFVGAAGIGLASGSLIVTVVLLLAFALYYPHVIVTEEKRLLARHGGEYADYCKRTPRYIPNLALWSEPKTYNVNVKSFRRAIFDAVWFVWVYGLIQAAVELHEMGALPVFFKIP